MFARAHHLVRFAVSAALAIGALALNLGTVRAADAPPPPYIFHFTEGVYVFLTLDEAQIRKMVPSGLKIAQGATGGIIAYNAVSPGGLGNFTGGYVYVDVEGFDSPSGLKGRFMLAGIYGPSDVAPNALRELGFPVRPGLAGVSFVADGDLASLSRNGAEILSAQVKAKPEPCTVVGGSVNYLAREGTSDKVRVFPIPFAGGFCGADPIHARINAPAGDPFGQVGAIKPVGAAIFRDLTVSLPAPIAAR